jgi:pSer/pThr/pTyr-binding forkhead associated (FHA) protein
MKTATFIVGTNPIVKRKSNDVKIKVDDKYNEVEKNHCKITYLNGKYYIEDLNTTNGTYVDGNKITSKTEISIHSKIKLGFNNDFSLNNKTLQYIINKRIDNSNKKRNKIIGISVALVLLPIYILLSEDSETKHLGIVIYVISALIIVYLLQKKFLLKK